MLERRFLADNRGNLAVGVAVLSVPLFVAVGMAADVTNMARVKVNVQQALDVASMEIAVNVPSNKTDSELEELGRGFFYAHLDPSAFEGGQMPNFRYNSLVMDADGVQHMSTETDYGYGELFGGLYKKVTGGHKFTLTARISVTTGDAACVYALSRSAPRAIEAGGNTSITMDGCVIASNSEADDSIYVGGSADIKADCLQSSGGIVASEGLTTDCEHNRTNAWPLPDPFAHFKEPVPPILNPDPKNSDTVVQPGRYSNLTLNGTKNLQPGFYYIEGDLSIKGDISGSGVTIFMKDGGITINGSASLSLSAPTTGDYAGMLFMSSSTNYSAHYFNGNGTTDLNGYLYFPKGEVSYTGNNGTTSNCLRIVADTVKMSGSSVLKSDCSAQLGGREARVSGPLYFSR